LPQPLHVDTTQLRIHAARLDAANAEATDQLTNNAKAVAACQPGWAGSTLAAFEQLRDTWELADTSRARLLEDIAMGLYRSADLYEHRDQTSGDQIERASD
jgi:WXG100 family type VII secretion target